MTTNTNENIENTSEATVSPLEKEVTALRTKNAELLGDLARFKQFRKSVDELGGLDTITEMVQTKKQDSQNEAEKNGDFTAVKIQYQDEIKSLKDNIDELKQGMVNSQVDAKLRQAVVDAGGTWEFVEPAIRKRISADFVDSSTVNLKILDDDGHQWIKDGNDAKLTDLVDLLKQDPLYTRAFETKSIKTGSGALGNKRKIESNPWMSDTQSLDEQTKLWIDNPDKARRLMQEAGISAGTRR